MLSFQVLFSSILDFLFPSPSPVLALEKMNPAEILEKAEIKTHPKDEWITSLLDYRSEAGKALIWEMKYRGNAKVMKILAEILHPAILDEIWRRETFSGFKEPVFVPIPISKERREERGWNQSELLGEALRKLDGGENFSFSPNLLVKIKNTESQTKAESRKARLRNLSGCFACPRPEAVRGKNIILLDDVVTTGATLSEARKTLLSSGAREVIAFTVAH